MGALIPIIAILCVFGVPVAITFRSLAHRERMQELSGSNPVQQKALQATVAERDALKARVQNLESIVCSVDFELNAKLNRLASRQFALPAAGSASSTVSMGDNPAPGFGPLKIGDVLAKRYTVEEAIGSGGMGAVYRARDSQLGELVAVKVIAGLGLLDPAAADRLRREASAARKISHPNVVRLHDIGEADGLLFLSMEYVGGVSVEELLRRHSQLPMAQVRSIAEQTCAGLAAAHAAGVIHRDLKPANILLDDNQRVKIIDFGLARLTELEGMTMTGMIVGTPEYMAPEQMRSGAIDARTDLYSLGVVLYRMLCGRPPFTGDNPIAISIGHAQDPVPAPKQFRVDLSDEWSSFLMRVLAKSPAERFSTADEMREALPPV